MNPTASAGRCRLFAADHFCRLGAHFHNDFPFATAIREKRRGGGEHGHGDVIISLAAIQAAGEEASSFLGHLPSAPEREG